MHDGSRAEPVLMAVESGRSESHDAWAGFPDDLKQRGLRTPLLAVCDGAAGLTGAIEIISSSASRAASAKSSSRRSGPPLVVAATNSTID